MNRYEDVTESWIQDRFSVDYLSETLRQLFLEFEKAMIESLSFVFQFLRDQASDREEVVIPLMLDGTYLSRNYATLGPMIRQPPCES